MKAVILAGGSVTLTNALKALCGGAALVVAADSGLRHAAALGLTPDLIVGDFDSVTADVLAAYPDIPRLEHPPQKNLLDLEIALDYAQEQGATEQLTEQLIVGGLGDRFDQSLAAVLIAARRTREGARTVLHSGDRAVYLLAAEEALRLELPPGQLFSLLSLADISTVTLQNAAYPLDAYDLAFGVGLGVSNEVKMSPLQVSLTRGLVALVLERLSDA